MNDLKVFSSTEFGELGVMLIDGKEYFPATQCAKILGYANPRDAINRHCKSDGVVKHDGVSYTTNQHGVTTQQITKIKYINEGNLYRLIVSSKLPSAEKFERWVFDEVLPSIRKNGSYGEINIEELVTKTATAVVTEVMKQLVPVLYSTHSEVIISAEKPKYKKPRKAVCKISRLEPAIRASVDEMLLSEKYTYGDIVNYLGSLNISISVTSVSRYNKRLHFKEEI